MTTELQENNLKTITGQNNPESSNDYYGLLTKETVLNKDLFIFSIPTDTDPLYDHSTKLIAYGNLYENIKKDIISYSSDINFSKPWLFNKLSSKIHIKTDIIKQTINNNDNNKGKHTAINVDYFNNNIVQQIYNLSNEIYTNNYLPSTPGDIITSSTLSTEALVQSVYGTETKWTQIQGRSIIGIGRADSNTTTEYGECEAGYTISKGNNDNRLGGEASVRLSINNLSTHQHTVKLDADKPKIAVRMSWINETNMKDDPESLIPIGTSTIITPETNWGVLARKPEYKYGVQGIKWSFTQWVSRSVSEMFMNVRSALSGNTYSINAWKQGTIGPLNARFTITTKVSTADIIGNGIKRSFASTIFSSNGNEYAGSTTQTVAKKHNNLPPFITKYIWVRNK